MSPDFRCCAVIAAAGASSRMNLKTSKQFIPLLGVPAIARTLLAFERAETISAAVIVCREEDCEQMKMLVRGCGVKKVRAVAAGGETRQQSVAAGIAAIPPECTFVAVHDGARPLVSPEEINACVVDAAACGAAALAVPVKDTIKVADGSGFIAFTPERSRLWAVQTPQIFSLSLYRKALQKAEADGMDYTDDCQLLEHAGVKVRLCRGNYENIKLTTPDDVIAAEAILRRREGSF